MTLQQRVDSDLKEAMRAKDATKLSVLRMLKSALKYAAIAKSDAEAELSDTEAVQVIRKQAKQRQDSIESFEKGGRAELADKEKEELAILNTYLPQGMSPDELAKVVRETIAELGATSKAQMGAVMKALQAKAGGRADGKTLSSEVQKQLNRELRIEINVNRSIAGADVPSRREAARRLGRLHDDVTIHDLTSSPCSQPSS